MYVRAKLIVEEIDPIAFDKLAKAPANKNMRIMTKIFGSPEPIEK